MGLGPYPIGTIRLGRWQVRPHNGHRFAIARKGDLHSGPGTAPQEADYFTFMTNTV